MELRREAEVWIELHRTAVIVVLVERARMVQLFDARVERQDGVGMMTSCSIRRNAVKKCAEIECRDSGK